MKDLQDLLNDFESIQDISISEEMLGAYVEGNLSGAELREVKNLINEDSFVRELYNSTEFMSPHIEDYDPSISFGEPPFPELTPDNEDSLNTSLDIIKQIDSMNLHIIEMGLENTELHYDDIVSSHDSTNDNSVLDSHALDDTNKLEDL